MSTAILDRDAASGGIARRSALIVAALVAIGALALFGGARYGFMPPRDIADAVIAMERRS